MKTLSPATSSDTEEMWARRADEICEAYLTYHRARLENEDGDRCLSLENDAASLAAEWDRHFEHLAGSWRAWCDTRSGAELLSLEAESGNDRLLVHLSDDSFRDVAV